MHKDLPVPSQFSHMAKAACLLLLHPDGSSFAVCSRRNSTVYGLPGGKMDPGETMAQTAVRETAEEIGVVVDVSKIELLFADAIPGDKDFWVETFIAVSPPSELKEMESGITVKWIDWAAFRNNNAFKEYNEGVYGAWQDWYECQQLNKPYTLEPSYFAEKSTAGSCGPS